MNYCCDKAFATARLLHERDGQKLAALLYHNECLRKQIQVAQQREIQQLSLLRAHEEELELLRAQAVTPAIWNEPSTLTSRTHSPSQRSRTREGCTSGSGIRA